MSVNSKMTAIADKIRSILGISGTMGLDAIVSNLGTVQTNIISAFTAVDNKGGIVPSSQVSGNLASAIASIPSGGGSSVQIVTGTFNTGDGMPSIQLDFLPDLFILHGDGYTDDEDYHTDSTLNFYFQSDFNWVEDTAEQMAWSDKYYMIDAMAYLGSNGIFSLSIWSCDESWNYKYIENETYPYTAIKFT